MTSSTDLTKILIVEDMPEIQRLLEVTLRGQNIAVYTADRGDRGLELALEERPDIILLDIMLPGPMDGLEVCRRLKSDPRTQAIPVLMVTAKTERADIQAGLAAGAEAYVTKPFSPVSLLEKVHELLEKHR